MFHIGVVENRLDPLKIGRCQVRVVGLHTEDRNTLPTKDLPWAVPVQPITSAGISGIGHTPVGPVEGTWVLVAFRDKDKQYPLMMGTLGGIPQSKAAEKNSIDGKMMTGQEYLNEQFINKELNDVTSTISSVFGSSALGQALKSVLGTFGINFGGSKIAPPNDVLGTSGNDETIVPQKVEPSTNALAADTQQKDGNPTTATSVTLQTDIPTKPPAKYSSSAKQEESIKAIIAACDKVGLTHKYAKCAILGIVGGESSWLPVEEGYSYSADGLRKTFYSAFKDNPSEADSYARWKGEPKEFFERVYSHKYANGQRVGNKQAGDGGKYYGRGFNQVTGKEGYAGLEKAMKKFGYTIDLINNPGILSSDVTIAAQACAVWYKTYVTCDQSSPSYFEAALKRTGNAVGTSYDKKKKLYEYFLGEGVIPDSTSKPGVGETKTYTEGEVKYLPKSVQDRLLEDRSENATVGFLDPNGKYPLRNLLDEPDTNRLARGVIKETPLEYKDATRTIGVPTANSADSTWEQPLAPWGGQYPYNKVYESESGHIMTFDDTPGHENIGLYHRKGSFIDVDSNGTMVQKIIGDGYVVMDRNGFITIAGKCNVHVGGDANIMVDGSADIEVVGVTNANFHSMVNIGCADDVNWSIGGDLNLKVDGKFNTTVKGDINTVAQSDVSLQGAKKVTTNATGNILQKSAAAINLEAKGKIGLKSGDATNIDGKSVSIKSASSLIIGGETMSFKSGSSLNIGGGSVSVISNGELHARASAVKLTSTSTTDLLSTGVVKLHGSRVMLQMGAAASSPSAADSPKGIEAIEAAKLEALTRAAPEVMATAGTKFDTLVAPVRPAPEINVKTDLLAKGDAAFADFQKNPSKYYNAEAAAAGVNPQRPPQPDIGDTGQSLRSGAEASDLYAFLRRQHQLAQEGHWTERGMGGKPLSEHNPNIIAMWKDIGMSNVMGSKGDQQAWCMAWVNWVLKQCNYRYVQSARAFDLRDKPTRWNATKVTSDPQPGDIIVWSFSHVSFVYDVNKNGTFTCIGGNQGGGKVSDNNPSGGAVTVNWKNGISLSNGMISGVYRPSKT